MLVYAIRHGECWTNSQGRFSAIEGNPLTDKGIEEAKHTGTLLENIKFDRIYSSDLLRAMQTAQTAIPGCNPVIDKRLRECNCGSLAMKSVRECHSTLGPEFKENMRKRDFSPYGGESTQQQIQRVSEFMHEIENLNPDCQIAVFCHEGTIKSMLSFALDCEFAFRHTTLSNGSVSVFKLENGNWKVKKWGITGNDLQEL